MVTACDYALLVQVLDVPHNPMAADPDRIEASCRARRVLPLPSPVGDGEGPGRLARLKPVRLLGMKGEPAAQRIIEIVQLGGAEQEIISGFTEDRGWPVYQCVWVSAKSSASISGVLASAPNNNGPFWVVNQRGEGDCLPRLDNSKGHTRRSVVAHRDKRPPLHLCLDEQDPLG